MSIAAIVATVAIAIALVIAIVVIRRHISPAAATPVPDMLNDEAFVKWLEGYEHWYTKSSKRYHRTLYWFRPAPIVIGFFVAIVAAIDEKSAFFPDWMPKNIVIIILTGLASFCVAVLTQLGVIDLSRTREIGRINCAQLVVRAKHFLSVAQTPQAAYEEKAEFINEIFKIEHDQAALFAGIVRNVPSVQSPPVQTPPRQLPPATPGP